MRNLLVLIMILCPFGVFAGIGGGGVGPRPGMLTVNTNVDFVKTLRIDQNKVVFQYKPYDADEVETQTVDLSELDEPYLKAISNSAATEDWMPVQ